MASAAASAARIRGLTKRYGGEQVALADVDLELAPGELLGLLGLNGAGKTTLLRTLFGLVEADSGSIELLGRKTSRGRRPALSGVAGFVEDPRFYSYLSGGANLELLAELDDGGGAGIEDCTEPSGTRSASCGGGLMPIRDRRSGPAARHPGRRGSDSRAGSGPAGRRSDPRRRSSQHEFAFYLIGAGPQRLGREEAHRVVLQGIGPQGAGVLCVAHRHRPRGLGALLGQHVECP